MQNRKGAQHCSRLKLFPVSKPMYYMNQKSSLVLLGF